MDEHVVSAAVLDDESKAFLRVKKLHLSGAFADDLVEIKRLLRGVLNGQKRMRKVTVRRVDQATGEIVTALEKRRAPFSATPVLPSR